MKLRWKPLSISKKKELISTFAKAFQECIRIIGLEWSAAPEFGIESTRHTRFQCEKEYKICRKVSNLWISPGRRIITNQCPKVVGEKFLDKHGSHDAPFHDVLTSSLRRLHYHGFHLSIAQSNRYDRTELKIHLLILWSHQENLESKILNQVF